MGDEPINGGIDRQMVGQTNQTADRLTQRDRDIQTESDRQTDHRVNRGSWTLNGVLRWT